MCRRASQSPPALCPRQFPERLLLPAVARLGLLRGLAEADPDGPDQDQAAAQAPPAQAEIKIHLRPVRRQGGGW